MEKSKPSPEAIIKLGNKITQELQLDFKNNTLGKWMAHYVAELIHEAENCETEEEKKTKQKECCEIILKLWRDREHIPGISKPLDELNPLIELLDKLKQDDYAYPHWLNEYKSENISWSKFADNIRNCSEEIFKLCFYAAVNSELLEKKQNWVKEHGDMLSEEELKMFEHLTNLVNGSKYLKIVFVPRGSESEKEINLDELSGVDRYNAIFDRIQSEIDEMSSKLDALKKRVISSTDKKLE